MVLRDRRYRSGVWIKLKELEDGLLFSLSNSQGDILDDIELIEGLEQTKVSTVPTSVSVPNVTGSQCHALS
eukprot:3376501-Rhodomonas_salina.4